jgi:septation ring formation regulator EzrA
VKIQYGTRYRCKRRKLFRVFGAIERRFTDAQEFAGGIGLSLEALQIAVI